MRAKLNCV